MKRYFCSSSVPFYYFALRFPLTILSITLSFILTVNSTKYPFSFNKELIQQIQRGKLF